MPLLAPKSDFDAAIALINAGDLAGAETRIRARLADYPRDVNMQALLGALLVKLNRAAEAETTAPPCDRAGADVRQDRTRISGYPARPAGPGRRGTALPRARDASRSEARERLVHARQGARGAGPGRRSRCGLRELLRALARAADDGARGRAPEGRPPRGGRAAVPARAAPAIRATSMRMRLLAAIAARAGRADEAEQPAAARRSRSRPISCCDPRPRPSAQGAGPLRRSARVLRPRDRARARPIRRRTSCAERRWRRPRSRTKRSRPTSSCLELQPVARRRAARTRASCSRRGPLRRGGRVLRRVHPRAARFRRDVLEPRQPEDLPLRRRDGRRDGAAGARQPA